MAPKRNETPREQYDEVIRSLSKRLLELEAQDSSPTEEPIGFLKKAQVGVAAIYQLMGIFVALLTLIVWLVVLREDVKRQSEELSSARTERTQIRAELWELKLKLAELKR